LFRSPLAMAVLCALVICCCARFCADRVVGGLAAGSHWGGEQHRCSVGWGAASLVCGGGGGWGGGIAGAAQVGGANPGLRQYQVDIVGGLLVAGQGGGDGADLLIAGGHQKRRGSAVAFHANNIEPGFGVGQHAITMGLHGATGMKFRIDQVAALTRCVDRVVELEAQFGEDVKVGSEPGGWYEHIHVESGGSCRGGGLDRQPVMPSSKPSDVEFGVHFNGPGGDQVTEPGPQRAAGGQFILGLAAVDRRDISTPYGPTD